MNVPKRGIVHAGGGKLVNRNGVVGGAWRADLAVQAEQVEYALGALRREACEQRGASCVRKCSAVNARWQLRQLDTAYLAPGENMDVSGQLEAQVRRAWRAAVVISRSDEHGHAHALQAPQKLLPGFKIYACAVKQVARKQHKVNAFRVRKLCQTAEQLALIGAAYRRLAARQPFKRGVEMQIRGVKYSQRAHFSLIASALRHLPVSGSMSNIQPSIMHAPFADS